MPSTVPGVEFSIHILVEINMESGATYKLEGKAGVRDRTPFCWCRCLDCGDKKQVSGPWEKKYSLEKGMRRYFGVQEVLHVFIEVMVTIVIKFKICAFCCT